MNALVMSTAFSPRIRVRICFLHRELTRMKSDRFEAAFYPCRFAPLRISASRIRVLRGRKLQRIEEELERAVRLPAKRHFARHEIKMPRADIGARDGHAVLQVFLAPRPTAAQWRVAVEP